MTVYQSNHASAKKIAGVRSSAIRWSGCDCFKSAAAVPADWFLVLIAGRRFLILMFTTKKPIFNPKQEKAASAKSLTKPFGGEIGTIKASNIRQAAARNNFSRGRKPGLPTPDGRAVDAPPSRTKDMLVRLPIEGVGETEVRTRPCELFWIEFWVRSTCGIRVAGLEIRMSTTRWIATCDRRKD